MHEGNSECKVTPKDFGGEGDAGGLVSSTKDPRPGLHPRGVPTRIRCWRRKTNERGRQRGERVASLGFAPDRRQPYHSLSTIRAELRSPVWL
jgi:hypothetical protein